MKSSEAKINTPVIYWRYIDNIVDGVAQVKSHPVFTIITGSPWALPGKDPIVNIDYQKGGASLIALDLLTLETLTIARIFGVNELHISLSPHVSDEIKSLIKSDIDTSIVGDFLHKTAEGIIIMGDGLKAFDKKAMAKFNEQIKNEAPDDYEQYGPEWEAEVMKLPKKAIVNLYKEACIKLQVAKDANWTPKN